jgi:hypothetical protein
VPKQIFEINTFNAGIVSDPTDEMDIPTSAATTSLNIDPLNDGELRGIPEVQVLKDTGFENNFSTISYTRPSNYATQETAQTMMQNEQQTQ